MPHPLGPNDAATDDNTTWTATRSPASRTVNLEDRWCVGTRMAPVGELGHLGALPTVWPELGGRPLQSGLVRLHVPLAVRSNSVVGLCPCPACGKARADA